MKNDVDTLALNDFDRDFLRQLKIEIPDDARWEIDADAVGSYPEAAA
jgi:hypothetical protein